MFKWFRNRRRDIKFANCFARAAEQQFDDGTISYENLEKCRRAADNPTIMRQSREQLTATDGRLGGIADWNWDAIWAWFQTYFIPAMKIIIPMLLLLETNPTPDEE